MEFSLKNENQIYSTISDLKAVLFDSTLLDLIKESMYIEGKACWLNHIDAALEKNDNHVHATTRMTPFEASNDKPISSLKPNNI